MHIVFIHRDIFPDRVGGTYSYTYELGRRLVARGHKLDVVASTQNPDAKPPFDIEGMRIHQYTYRRINPMYSVAQHLNNTYRVYAGVASGRPVDILSIHDPHLGLKVARSDLGRSSCQVTTFHAPASLEFRLNRGWEIDLEPSPVRRFALRLTASPLEHWQRRFEAGVLNAAQGILVLSRYSLGHIENNYPTVDTSKVKIIPSGVDTERFRPAADKGAVRRKLGLQDNATYFLSVRNLNPRMGLPNLIDAMRQVLASPSAEGEDVRLLICGRGPLKEQLEAQIAECGLADRVTLTGRVSGDDLTHYYQASDLFVLPTETLEGFGIVTVEALSVNLPVIGTPAGATPEILSQVDSRLLTRDTSADAIAEAIISWLGWRRGEMGTTRYRDEALAKYSWEHVTDEVEAYYAEQARMFKGRRHDA